MINFAYTEFIIIHIYNYKLSSNGYLNIKFGNEIPLISLLIPLSEIFSFFFYLIFIE